MGFGKDGKGVIIHAGIVRGALGALPAQSFTTMSATLVDFNTNDSAVRILKGEILFDIHSKTTGDGPVMIGLCDGQYTDAELEEAFEAFGTPWTVTGGCVYDRAQSAGPEHEQSQRPIWPLLLVPNNETNQLPEEFGNPIIWNPRWTFHESLKVFAFNMEQAALTTGMLVTCYAKLYGVDVAN